MTSQHLTGEPRLAFWMMLLGNLLIGTGIMLPAGMLLDLAHSFDVSEARAAKLILTSGLVVGIGAPLLAALTNAVDRRVLLAGSLALYAVGHAASAMVTDFNLMIALRALTVVGAAIFTPQAAATVGSMVVPERRAAVIAFIFIGWSVASVAGMPLAAYISAKAGWQTPYILMAGLCALGTVGIWLSMPGGIRVPHIAASSWFRALSTPSILSVLAVTALALSGQFSVFSYFAPIMANGFGASPEAFVLVLVAMGIAGIAGNMLAARLVLPLGIDRTVFVSLAVLFGGVGLFTLGFGVLAIGAVGACIWSLGTFATVSLQQSRVVARAPELASATVALNTSVVYLGQATGTYAGGLVVAQGIGPGSGLLSLAFLAAAVAMSVLAARLGRA